MVLSDNNNIDFIGLLCHEDVLGFEYDEKECARTSLTLLEHDVFWEHDEVLKLLRKEKECHNVNDHGFYSHGSLGFEGRREAVEWILRVVKHYGFGGLTCVLAVGYYDRFVCSVYFQKDKPWMSQLVAVACLSIAAKMEEITVPLLVDLQVENSKYVFEAKTIMKMELLVLSGLKWRTNIVTPISFFDHIVRRFGLWTNHHKEFFKRCEQILLFLITDSKTLCYLSSVIAAATMLFVLTEIDPDDLVDYQNQLLDILGIHEDKVKEFYHFIMDVMGSHSLVRYGTHKRKQTSSPNGVIDAYISSSDSSNDADLWHDHVHPH